MTIDLLGFVPQAVPPLLDVKRHSGEVGVALGAHEEQLVAASAPRGLDVLGPRLVVLGPRHDPAEHADRALEAGAPRGVMLGVQRHLALGGGRARAPRENLQGATLSYLTTY